jgi:hypothetical protein
MEAFLGSAFNINTTGAGALLSRRFSFLANAGDRRMGSGGSDSNLPLWMETDAGERSCLEVLQHADHYRQHAHDPEKAEYFVQVDWLETASTREAFWAVGLFGNQNMVCQPSTQKWRHTIERLKTRFRNWDAQPG